MLKSMLTIAAVAVLGAGVLTTSADAAPAPRCYKPIEAVGTGQGALGAGSKKARAAAIVDFEQKASALHGAKYAKFSKAQTVKRDCRSGALEAKCVITARPCR
jgi:hypothetical protein